VRKFHRRVCEAWILWKFRERFFERWLAYHVRQLVSSQFRLESFKSAKDFRREFLSRHDVDNGGCPNSEASEGRCESCDLGLAPRIPSRLRTFKSVIFLPQFPRFSIAFHSHASNSCVRLPSRRMLIGSFRFRLSWKSWPLQVVVTMSFTALGPFQFASQRKTAQLQKNWLKFDLGDLSHNPISHELFCIFQSKLLWKTSRASKFERTHLEVIKAGIHHLQEKPPPGEPLRKENILRRIATCNKVEKLIFWSLDTASRITAVH